VANAVSPSTGAPESGRTAIVVDRVSKSFRIPHQQYSTLKERALHPLRPNTSDVFDALKDVSFSVEKGEFFGIVGRNGSGKSTLLKCLAGIYGVDAGWIGVEGRVSPFIELGVGFNPDLTARDNVLINGVMLGLPRKHAKERFDHVIEFAGLEEFVDLKLKNYSSGMSVRLAFSVAVLVDAEIIIVDEVLAVGDAAFQQKCFEEFQRMKDEGRTIVFVTHDMGMVERFCDRAMLIEKGEIVEMGEPLSIARRYNELNFGRLPHAVQTDVPEDDAPRIGSEWETTPDGPSVVIEDAWFENSDAERVVALPQGQRCRVRFSMRILEELADPIFAVTLRNEAHHTILVLRTDWRHGPTGTFGAGERAFVTFQFENELAPSRYTLSPSVARDGSGAEVLAAAEDMTSVIVHGTYASGGVLDPDHQVAIDHA